MLKRLPKKIDVTVHLGELVDGPANNKKKKYATLVTRLEDQTRIVKKLLRPIRTRSKRLYCLIGSEYHEDEWGEASRAAAKDAGADVILEDPDDEDNNEYACYNLFLQFGDVIIDFAHHGSVTMVNRSMPLEREIRYRKVDNPIDDEVEGEIKCVVRAHSHVFGVWQDRHGVAIRCPGWQFPYFNYGTAKASIARSYPDIGWILLKVTPGKEWPIEVFPHLYDYPKSSVIRVE